MARYAETDVARRRGRIPALGVVIDVMVRPKRWSATTEDIASEVDRLRGFGAGDKKPWKYDVNIYRSEGRLKARLSVEGEMVVGLDFHVNSVGDNLGGIVPPGYHWDLHPPLVEKHIRVAAPSRPEDLSSLERSDRWALALLRWFWHIRLDPDPPTLLRRR